MTSPPDLQANIIIHSSANPFTLMDNETVRKLASLYLRQSVWQSALIFFPLPSSCSTLLAPAGEAAGLHCNNSHLHSLFSPKCENRPAVSLTQQGGPF
jgi:hypothetical protein